MNEENKTNPAASETPVEAPNNALHGRRTANCKAGITADWNSGASCTGCRALF